MTFVIEPTRTPDAIQNIVVTLKDAIAHGDEDAYKSAHFVVNVLLSDGTVIHRKGDLVPHITVAQRDALMAFMNSLRTQAISEIMPRRNKSAIRKLTTHSRRKGSKWN